MIYSTSDLHIRQREILNAVEKGEEVIITRRKESFVIKRYDTSTLPAEEANEILGDIQDLEG